MLNKKTTILMVVLLFIAFCLVATGCGTSSNRQAGTPADKVKEKSPSVEKSPSGEKEASHEKAPAFTLAESISGKEVSFPADFKGKKVMLTFFSSS